MNEPFTYNGPYSDIIKIKNDSNRTIERLEKRVEELERDREILKKEIDRLSEYGQNLERMLKK
jgi:prefoldin subunit 5